ncbi:MAG TPA: lysophospholipid acyltransferase family protein [Tepidisphaeraceae bacterium]|jgi:KDO2-lipid IV(A) lauroyltransferase|nr:lysophospholipid acyltransferase family protein [Tepidisphaeraceae bacterium]
MGKERNDFLDRITYLGVRLVSAALHCFPVDTNLRTAQFIGQGMYLIDRKHRQRAMHNLRRSFPAMSERQLRLLVAESMQQLVMLAVEILFTTRLIRLDTWAGYCTLENFADVLALLLKRGQGVIMLTGHYGNWEILGYVLATLGFETTSVARPLDNPYLNDWIMGVRERQGQKIVGKKGATTEVVEVLERGGAVGFIADQNAGSKGIFVDFFGRKASTYKSIGLLAMQYNVPVVIGYARRTHGRFQFRLGVQDVIYPQDWKDQDDPLRYITQRYTLGIENVVRDDPGQYLWSHRRWKTRPKGEEPEAYD